MDITFGNTLITRAIIDSYHEFYCECVTSDVLIAGAGPSGLMAAIHLAKAGASVTIVEKRLSTGGGIWGGGMTQSRIVIQNEARGMLDELEVRTKPYENVHVCDSIELASALTLKALHAGARILNVHVVEDLCIAASRVTGLVVNHTEVYKKLPVDPLMLESKVTLDATGHEAVLVDAVRRKVTDAPGRATSITGEGPMDAYNAEDFVVERTGRFYPGLYISGMAVCAAYGGPRMGPIFGGMLMSGAKVAELILVELKKRI
jgi:thiamine thiazole synthase